MQQNLLIGRLNSYFSLYFETFSVSMAQHFPMPALIFRKADEFLSEIEKAYGKEQLRAVQMGLTNSVRMSIIYYPQVNVFRGIAEKQIIIHNYCFSNTSV